MVIFLAYYYHVYIIANLKIHFADQWNPI